VTHGEVKSSFITDSAVIV